MPEWRTEPKAERPRKGKGKLLSKNQPKTEGLEWLDLSLASFNGSGYADRRDCFRYVESYKAYKTMKQDMKALVLLEQFWHEAITVGHKLCTESLGPGKAPSQSGWKRFKVYYPGL